MKASFVLSIMLDVLAIVVMLIPVDAFRNLSTDRRRVTNAKRVGALLLLAAGFLIDHYVTHAG